MLLLAAGLLVACGPDVNPPQPETQEEIRLDASVWQMMQGAPSRRVSTYEGAPLRASTYNGGTLTSGSFTAAAYVENTTTPYINPVQVNWETDKWVWSDGKHYWPASGSLDFFAYMPATKPGYISSITYAVSGAPAAPQPSFVCADLPMTYNSAAPTENQGSNLHEFILAVTTGQNKVDQGATGVTMNFSHPFVRIKMVLSASQAKAITINTITFKSLKNNGSCSFAYNGSSSTWESTWTPSGVATNFKATLDQAFTATGAAQDIGVPYLMIPQTWTGGIEVEATWDDWGVPLKHTLSTTLSSVSWAPGTTYTYTFTITETDLIVDGSKYTEQW